MGASFKDHFSKQAQDYARYRPRYPETLFDYLTSLTHSQQTAWDCATGNGQVALSLTPHFEQIYATDASAQQIDNAFEHQQIQYSVVPAERSQLPSQSIDLITVGQAFHWFDHLAFFQEVKRVLRPGGAIAIWSYGFFELPEQEKALNQAIQSFYAKIEPYWPPEAELVHNHYRSIEFPFEEQETPPFAMTPSWTLEAVVGYFMTWSAVQRYLEAEGEEAIAQALEPLRLAWTHPESSQSIHWPLRLRVFRLN